MQFNASRATCHDLISAMLTNPAFTLLAAGLLCAAQLAPAMDLVRDGQPTATIVIATNTSRMVRFAAAPISSVINSITTRIT